MTKRETLVLHSEGVDVCSDNFMLCIIGYLENSGFDVITEQRCCEAELEDKSLTVRIKENNLSVVYNCNGIVAAKSCSRINIENENEILSFIIKKLMEFLEQGENTQTSSEDDEDFIISKRLSQLGYL